MKFKTVGLVLAGAVMGGAAVANWQQEAVEMGGATAGKAHQVLQQMNGTWDASVEMTMLGGQTSTGSEVVSAKMNDLWVVGDFSGEMMGSPFQGLQLTGYDTKKEKYVGVWVDSTSDVLSVLEGEYDEATKSLVLQQETTHPMTGQTIVEKHVTEFVSDTQRVFKIVWPGPDGGDVVAMKIDYTKKQ